MKMTFNVMMTVEVITKTKIQQITNSFIKVVFSLLNKHHLINYPFTQCFDSCIEQSRNWLSSPIGTELLLSLIENGRKTNNYLQMSKDLKDIKGYYSKTKVFLSPEHKLGSSHHVDIEKVDFKNSEAKENICKWVKDERSLKCWDIKKYISSTTKYVLINISNLQMPWYASNMCGPLMTIYNTFSYTEDIKYEARMLELPLQNKYFKVVILVPNEMDVLHNLFNKLIKEGFNAATSCIQPCFTAVSELKAPKIEFEAVNQLTLEENNCDMMPRKCISFGDVNINNNGAFFNCISCVFSEDYIIQAPSITKQNTRDSCTMKPFLFTINYRDNPIFTGQYVCPE